MISLKVGTADNIQKSPFNSEQMAIAHDTGEIFFDLPIGNTNKRIKSGSGNKIITSSTMPVGGFSQNDVWLKVEE